MLPPVFKIDDNPHRSQVTSVLTGSVLPVLRPCPSPSLPPPIVAPSQLRHHAYFCFPEWTGGLYVTPTIAGSRPGALSAACWASMVSQKISFFFFNSSNVEPRSSRPPPFLGTCQRMIIHLCSPQHLCSSQHLPDDVVSSFGSAPLSFSVAFSVYRGMRGGERETVCGCLSVGACVSMCARYCAPALTRFVTRHVFSPHRQSPLSMSGVVEPLNYA